MPPTDLHAPAGRDPAANVSDGLAGEYGIHVLVPGARFARGQDVIDADLAGWQAIPYRFQREGGA